jgi:dihydroflavonol-4-reductase
VLGPALGADTSHSIQIVKRLLDGQAGSPKVNTGIVDVRDVADLHVRAMANPAAAGERFIATAGESVWLVEIAKVLRRRMGAVAGKVSTRVLPSWFVRLLARRNPAMGGIVPLLGLNLNATSEKARRVLGWAPRSSEEAIVAAAESLVRLGLVRA